MAPADASQPTHGASGSPHQAPHIALSSLLDLQWRHSPFSLGMKGSAWLLTRANVSQAECSSLDRLSQIWHQSKH